MVDSNSLMIILYTKVFPFLSIFLTSLILCFIVFVPSCIKTMIKAWRSRGAGALMFLANDDGFVDIEWMTGEMGQGIFTGKTTNYVVTPRPRYVPEKIDPEHPLHDLNSQAKEKIDQLIQTRHILGGLGKPVYFGYKGKSIAISPALLNAMEHAPENQASLNLMDPRTTIKLYVPFTFSPSLIDALTFKHEQIGYFSRPLDKLKQNAVPVGLIIVIMIAAYFLMTGKINIPGLS